MLQFAQSDRGLTAAAFLLLIALVFFVFVGYLLGVTTPPWDFYGAYLTDAYSWWDLGSLANPPQFLPYVAGGYPAYLALQSSGWYLPVGLASMLSDYTPHFAAILQAITVAFGVVGAYSLARVLRLARWTALVAGTAFLFTAGFFSNAQHVDIVRAWAFMPWLLLTLSGTWWRSPVRIIGAALLWWQFFVGAYPGNVAAAAYLCAGWAAIMLYHSRGRRGQYLAWVGSVVGAGLLLAMPKWLPFLLAAESEYLPGNQIIVNPDLLATFFFPFTSETLPNDLTMRTFFVVPIMLIAAFFAHGNRRLIQSAGSLIVTGAVLGWPLPLLRELQDLMPLLDISRFRTADFKVGVALGIVLLGAAGLESLAAKSREPRPRNWWVVRVSAATLVVAAICLLGVRAGLPPAQTAVGLVWVAASLAALLFTAWATRRQANSQGSWIRLLSVPTVVLAATALIGGTWAATFWQAWQTPREKTEILRWGESADGLIADAAPVVLPERPARSAPEFPATYKAMRDKNWNGAAYARSPTTGGYVSTKGVPLYEQLLSMAQDPEAVGTMQMISAPSAVWVIPAVSNPGRGSEACALSGDCVPAGLKVVEWRPDRVTVTVPRGVTGRVVVNELAYAGWTATSCSASGCSDQQASSATSLFVSAVVEEDATSVTFSYQTPHRRTALSAQWLGVLVLAVACLGTVATQRRQRAQGSSAFADMDG